MASYNRVIVVGNLTRDIELRYTPGGTAVADIAIAVNERRKSASGEWVEEVTFIDVTMWGRTAEVASEYLGKGSPILVEGRLKQERWESEGKKRSKLKVVCDRMQMLSGTTGPGDSGRSDSNQSSSSGHDNRSPQQSSASMAHAGDSGATMSSSSNASQVHESSAHQSTQDQATQDQAGQRDAQPTGDGPGYDEPDIPF
ncbi:Single-stranded DNA-binding protein [Rubripirellula obstinata]|uniref:Single-stranded DNA-binding protein n=1 Tax=Rubripirellula obstinata TaxID=406547 RepID=A0A5B1CFQ9_9BACT|nr:single-stranded DNA-binding protein [Rubripirellula obstinata]KAA1259041.1 Single-stranded DNA-binding protein [Rubripirellula obstinata]